MLTTHFTRLQSEQIAELILSTVEGAMPRSATIKWYAEVVDTWTDMLPEDKKWQRNFAFALRLGDGSPPIVLSVTAALDLANFIGREKIDVDAPAGISYVRAFSAWKGASFPLNETKHSRAITLPLDLELGGPKFPDALNVPEYISENWGDRDLPTVLEALETPKTADDVSRLSRASLALRLSKEDMDTVDTYFEALDPKMCLVAMRWQARGMVQYAALKLTYVLWDATRNPSLRVYAQDDEYASRYDKAFDRWSDDELTELVGHGLTYPSLADYIDRLGDVEDVEEMPRAPKKQ